MRKKVSRWIVGIVLSFVTAIGMGGNALAAPKTMPDGTIFDAEYYATNNPDVVAALGTDESVLYQHYVMFGKNEGRQPYAVGTDLTSVEAQTPSSTALKMPDGNWFDPIFYAQAYPDVVAVLGTDVNVLYAHYVNFGKAEGRQPYGVTYTTISMETLEPYAQEKSGLDHVKRYQDYRTDNFGNVYSFALRGISGSNTNAGGWEKFYLAGQYNYLIATVAVMNPSWPESTESIAGIRIYGDDRLLWSNDQITIETHPYEIKVDVTGVQNLQIEMRKGSPKGYYGICPLLGNPSLSRIN